MKESLETSRTTSCLRSTVQTGALLKASAEAISSSPTTSIAPSGAMPNERVGGSRPHGGPLLHGGDSSPSPARTRAGVPIRRTEGRGPASGICALDPISHKGCDWSYATSLRTPGPRRLPGWHLRPWTLTRHDDELRIDLIQTEPLSQVENRAVIDALKKQLADDGVTTVRLDGPAVNTHPVPQGFGGLADNLGYSRRGRGPALSRWSPLAEFLIDFEEDRTLRRC